MGLFDKLLGRGNSANNDSKDISVLHEEKARQTCRILRRQLRKEETLISAN